MHGQPIFYIPTTIPCHGWLRPNHPEFITSCSNFFLFSAVLSFHTWFRSHGMPDDIYVSLWDRPRQDPQKRQICWYPPLWPLWASSKWLQAPTWTHQFHVFPILEILGRCHLAVWWFQFGLQKRTRRRRSRCFCPREYHHQVGPSSQDSHSRLLIQWRQRGRRCRYCPEAAGEARHQGPENILHWQGMCFMSVSAHSLWLV